MKCGTLVLLGALIGMTCWGLNNKELETHSHVPQHHNQIPIAIFMIHYNESIPSFVQQGFRSEDVHPCSRTPAIQERSTMDQLHADSTIPILPASTDASSPTRAMTPGSMRGHTGMHGRGGLPDVSPSMHAVLHASSASQALGMGCHPGMHSQEGSLDILNSAHGPDAPPTVQPEMQDVTPPPLQVNISVGDLITVPGAFSRQLVRDHLNPAARLALSRTCTTARDLVLGTAEHATIHLDVSNQPSCLARLPAVSIAMAARGQLRTKLHLAATNPHQLSYALGVLREGITPLHEVTVWCDEVAIPTGLLATIGCGCPNLRALTIHFLWAELPSPELFPQLKQLTIRLADADDEVEQHMHRIFLTIQPYIKQLTLLAFPTWFDPPTTLLPALLMPGQIADHLRTLVLCTTLNDTLLGLILQCAPAIEQLTVDYIELQTATHAHAQHQWRRLEFRRLYLSSLARLPLVAGMQLVWDVGATGYVMCDSTSMEPSISDCLKDVQLSMAGDRLTLYCGSIDVVDQPAALRMGLSLLRHWPAPKPAAQPRLSLELWNMSVGVMEELAGLPHFNEFDFSQLIWPPQSLQLHTTLIRVLPGMYHTVHIDVQGLSYGQVESICLGAPQSRMPEAPLHIILCGCAPEVLEPVQYRVQGWFPNVHVTNCQDRVV